MRVLAIHLCTTIDGFQCFIFRRISADLELNHMDGPKGFRAMLAPWVNAGLVQIVQGEIRFLFNGSKIFLCHCQHKKNIYDYQGAEMHALFIDEVTHFEEDMVRFLRSRVRIPGVNIPPEWKARLPLCLYGGNPIGVGVEWFKRWFVEPRAPMEMEKMPNDEGGMIRQYIPALLEDNPSMSEDDPGYEARLEGLGAKALVKAMRWGLWDQVQGAFFPDFYQLIIRPHSIPAHWPRFRSIDWGSAKPFSVGWWAMSTGEGDNGNASMFRRGEVIRYREWYGKIAPNEGLKLRVEEVAEGIAKRTPADERIVWTVADPSMFKEDGGPSHAERMANCGVPLVRGDNNRKNGWQGMYERMRGEDERPWSWCWETCYDSVRTIPNLVHDDIDPEDLNTDGEDHAADDWRYFHQSRPWARPQEREVTQTNVTMDRLIQDRMSQRRSKYA